jgi:beta-carotene 3-hydroxylase
MAEAAIDILITLAAFLGMEAFAWTVHRYVMHGPLGWIWHASHHSEHNRLGEGGGAERNDLFAVVFALPAIILFIIGAEPGRRAVWFAGLGVTLYGVMYWIVHDGFVHQRWPMRIRAKRGYVKRLVQAHRLHHSTHGRTGAVSFGFLYAREPRYLKAKLQAGAQSPNRAASEASIAAPRASSPTLKPSP